MGTTFKALGSTSLYDFWGERVTAALNDALQKQRSPLLVNLASVEYYKVVREKQLQARVISPVFKDFSNGQYKIVSFFAKKARGLMSAWILRNRLKKPEDLLAFDVDGYHYSAKDSTGNSPVFLRRED
jgi:cytoplasmic iron level regulating protein YaaA (DUF328/UPF0246 family)